MAFNVLTNAYIKIDDIVLEKAASSVAISYSAEPVEIGVMGERNVQRYGGGPLDWSVEMEVVIDESIHGQAFFDMMGESVELEIRPTSDAVSETNPAYMGTAILTSYTPLGSGNHGDVAVAALSFVGAGDLQRVTVATP